MADDNFMKQARDRMKAAIDGEKANRDEQVDDLQFLNGNQWPQTIKTDRESDGRPCLIINKLPRFVDQVEGDQRQNRPSIKVRPVDSASDPEIADILQGIIRNIENVSNADICYDTAFNSAICCGEGAFRILTEYTDDDVFEQDIVIRRISNHFTVHYDPKAQEIDRSDGDFAFISEQVSREEYKTRWPGKTPVAFSETEDDFKDWVEKDEVTVAEYFWKKPVTTKLYQVRKQEMDGTETIFTALEKDLPFPLEEGQATIDVPGVGQFEVIDQREVKTHQVKWSVIDGHDKLEEDRDWAGKYIPVVPVWGKELNIQGKRIVRGLIRHAKDSQRLYNYFRSLSAETMALAPKAPFLLTPAMIQNQEAEWNNAHKKTYPYLLYNPDPDNPGPPQRQFPNPPDMGQVTEIQISDQEMHDTTGLQQASLGEVSNEKSGKAIIARQREGDVATFAYIDNLARGLEHAGKILVDLIPKIYDTERIVRLRGEDDSELFAPINASPEMVNKIQGYGGPKQLNPATQLMNDITVGKYDVVVTVGPSYTTQRVEALDSMIEFVKAVPTAGPIIQDLIAKNMDWQGSEEISDRLKKLLPPGLAEDEEPPADGVSPPGAAAGPPPIPPEVQIAGETAEVKLEQEKVKLVGLQLENEKKEAEIAKIKEESRTAQ